MIAHPVSERLVLRAASSRYSHLVGQLTWGIDEGLTGWVARNRRASCSSAYNSAALG
jgi:hypothetical protein